MIKYNLAYVLQSITVPLFQSRCVPVPSSETIKVQKLTNFFPLINEITPSYITKLYITPKRF